MSESTQTGKLTAAPWMDRAIDPLPWINKHLRGRKPFLYLRFNDGEAYSMCGLKEAPESNGEHVYTPSIRRSLLRAFVNSCCAAQERDDVLVGSWWMEDVTHPASMSLLKLIHLCGFSGPWARGSLWHREEKPCPNEELLEMVKLVKAFAGPKYFVGNSSLAPVAAALGGTLYEIPATNAETARPIKPSHWSGIYLWCGGFPIKEWAWNSWDTHHNHAHIDCGALFDGLVGNESRSWLKRGSGPHADFYYGEFKRAVGL